MLHKKNKWVVVFLIHADLRANDDETFLLSEKMKIELNCMFKDIITCKLNKEKAKLFVLFQGIKFSPQIDGSFKIEDIVLFYEIVPAKSGLTNDFHEPSVLLKNIITIPDMNSHLLGNNLQKDSKLAEALSRVPVGDDEEILLVTWDHGSAFGIFRGNPTNLVPLKKTPIDFQLERYPYLKLFWDVAMKDDNMRQVMDEKKITGLKAAVQIGVHSYRLPSESTELFSHQRFLNLYQIDKTEDNKPILNFNQALYSDILSGSEPNLFTSKEVKEIDTLISSGHGKQILLNEPEPDEILKNAELANALEAWLNCKENDDKKVGVLLMMNCWMMNMHTMYAMKDAVKCLVAPQGGIDSPGYNYKDILAYINETGGSVPTPEELSKKIVCLSKNKFIRRRARKLNKDFPNTIENRTIFAVKLNKEDGMVSSEFEIIFAKLKEIVEEISNIIRVDADSPFTHLLKTLRLLSFDFTNKTYFLIDFPNFLLAVQSMVITAKKDFKHGTFFNLNTKIAMFDTYCSSPSLILNKFQGRKAFEQLGQENTLTPGLFTLTSKALTGFSLFFATGAFKKEDINQLDVVEADMLLENLPDWKDLLNKIYKEIIIK